MENEKLIEEAKATQNATDLAHGLWDNLAEANFRISELEAALAAAMEREKVISEVRDEQRSGRQKYGRGPDDTEHDDIHTVQEWVAFIVDHASRAVVATPIESRQELVKTAGMALSAIESFDRKSALSQPEKP